MPNRLQQFLVRLKSIFNDIAFGADVGMTTRGRSGRTYYLPGTHLNWDELAGDAWECPAVAICLNYLYRNMLQAPPTIYTRDADNKRVAVPNNRAHPLIQLLSNPNPDYGGDVLLMSLIFSFFVGGNSYWAVERAGRTGLPAELWWLPHFMVVPKRDKQTGERFYQYRVGGKNLRIDPADMVHVRWGIDPYNVLAGLSPTSSVQRGIYTLQQASTYGARNMRNFGMTGAVMSPENSTDEIDGKSVVETWQDKTTGDRAGELIYMDIPVKMQWPMVTPEKMALDTIQDRPEADVAALFGLPPQAVGLHVGRLSKTYANVKEAREAAWEECILPTNAIFGTQIGNQLLPQLSRNADAEELGFDITDIRPLQPDLDEKWERVGKAFERGGIDRATFEKELGLPVNPASVGVYFSDMLPPKPVEGDDGGQRTSMGMTAAAQGGQGGQPGKPLNRQRARKTVED